MPDLFAAIPTAHFALGRAWWERFFGRTGTGYVTLLVEGNTIQLGG